MLTVNYNIKNKYTIPTGKFKVFSQHTDQKFDNYSCAPRCLQTVLNHFGLYVSIGDLMEDCKTDESGTFLTDVAEVAEAYGFLAKYHTGDVERIKRYIRRGYLVILSFSVNKEESHCVVAFEYNSRFIYALDTTAYTCCLPVVIIDTEILRKLWKDFPEDADIVAIKAKK